MEKEYISYEQALALKELGFKEPCFAIYNLGLSEFEIANIGQIRLFSSIFRIDDKQSNISYVNDKNSSKVTAPLYQQCFRWFREKHSLEFSIDIQTKKPYSTLPLEKTYSLMVIKSDEVSTERHNKLLWTKLNMKSIEEAELECLKKLIEIVKNKK